MVISDRRRERPSSQDRRRHRRGALAGQRVGRPFEGEGHRDGRELGGEQQHHGAQHAQLQVAAVGRPDIGPQVDHGLEQRAAVGGDGSYARRIDGGGDGRSFRAFV